MSIAITTGTKNGHPKGALRQGLHGIAWALALLSVGQGFCHLSAPQVSRVSAVPVLAEMSVVPLPASARVPGVWRWRFGLVHGEGALPRLRLHTWQARNGKRSDDRVLIPLDLPQVRSGGEVVDVTLSPGPSKVETEYRGDPAAQLYVCDTLKLQVVTSAPGSEKLAVAAPPSPPQTIFVANPFRAAETTGPVAEALPAVVVKDGPRQSVSSNATAGQTADLAVAARPSWGVTGAATLEFDAFK